ncbi:MAG: DNA repair protein RecN [Cohnella sp.]|jgi:DNA repair protein RecN (Recombination protein N)|uniref:DNA repair protein RecN n=1 Tax=Cohnella sp. TaxID=1883426 RepID=UPI000E3A087B|nr:DNA repair protein RecN [Cohnella sp.]REK66037.1 MAG: DNA repair protein RecN [Cohnella sp.]
MLRELSIRNLAVIEQVTVLFHSGFHVLTGETGAGKSMIIDALGLIAGGRGSAEMIRHGCERADVEAVFDLPDNHPVWSVLDKFGIEADPREMLVIRREIMLQGKSSARINGQSATLTMLREVGEHLINIHGQHEHQSLLRTERHLEWLDQYAGEEIAADKSAYAAKYEQFRQVERERKELEETSRHQMQMLDLYRYQLEEIAEARLKPGEDESLAEERRKLSHAEKLAESVSEAYDLLSGAKGLSAISRAISRLEDIVNVDPSVLKPLLEQLQSAYYAAEDAAYQLRSYRDNVEFNPERLALVEDRLDLLYGLKRKYGETIEDILAYRERIQAEADKLENRDERLQQLIDEEKRLYRELAVLAERLTAIRKNAARRLSEVIVQELRELQMERAVFEVRLEQAPLSAAGADNAEFLLSTNPGEPPKPLSKIASGGEMSRVMLALKAIFARIDRIPVLVFDEVDTGVSGRAAQAVADKLSRLAGDCQVFAITHLPQVACMADYQFEIAKRVNENGRTSTSVRELEGGERVEELARMLGGVEVTEKTRHHAQEMLALAIRQKNASRREKLRVKEAF